MAFLGQDGFYWGMGVVEDRFDPEKLNRVRVRWLGIHDDGKENILTKALPWSTVMQPATATSMAGIGEQSAVVEGTWVVGFTKDTATMQDWVVMGTLPGLNTTTAYRGGRISGDSFPNSEWGAKPHARAWNKARGDLKEFEFTPSTGTSSKYIDYEKGFYDPTMDQRDIPHPPSDASYGNPGSGGGHVYTPPKDAPGFITLNDPDKKINRVPNWAIHPLGDHPSIHDLDPLNEKLWDYEYRPPIAFARATHSDVLHYLFKTTRRITADRRFLSGWIDFGTFRWPDSNTYMRDGFDKLPEKIEVPREYTGSFGDHEKGREGVIFSTGYLEPNYWSEDREYASKGGTWGPAFPITRDKPAVSTDPAGLTGIGELDTRAGWGQASGEETGYWAIKGEDYRVPHPRVRWVRKMHLSPTERRTCWELFNAGHYGTGEYNVSDPDEGRQDIMWRDVKEDDLIVVPTPDTNALAMGGIPISFTDGVIVETKSSLWADDTTYFNDPELSKGKPTKPLLQAGDIVQIAGVRGMQEINGRIFRLLDCADNGSSFSMELGTVNGQVWAGPSDIDWEPTPAIIEYWDEFGVKKERKSIANNGVGEPTIMGVSVDNANFSEYLGGGVVIPHNPHWMLCWKADMRERQINIGSPDPETGVNAGFWNQPTGDFNATYPFNHVYESESGHVMEYDDTPGAERIHQFHRSGTHYEIDHNGSRTNYVKGDNYDIRLHDDYMYVKGKVVHTFDDEVMIRYNDRADISAAWKLQLWSGGDLDIHSKRNINMKADGDINMQADGHINIGGTTLTHAVADTTMAGSRVAKEFSKVKIKTGHFVVEAIGDIDLPREYAINLQGNEGPIGIKTLHDNDAGNIHIASGWDMELFSWRHQYRTAGKISNPSNIYDYAIDNIFIEAEAANIEITVPAGYLHATVMKEIDLKSCTEDIRLQSVAKDINLKAKLNVLVEATDEDIDLTAALNINGKAGVDITLDAADDLMVYAGDEIRMRSVGDMLLSSIDNIKIDAEDNLHLKADLDVYIEAVGQSVNILAGEMVKITGTDYVDILASIINLEAAAINLNGSSVAATAASNAFGPAVQTPTLPDDALSSIESDKAFILDTLELLSIDLPNPRPAVGTSISQLALNEMKPDVGFGGENIRNLHDGIADMEKGLSAYVTKKYPATDEMKVYEMDQSEAYWTGMHQSVVQDPWNGETGEPFVVPSLGPERAIRYAPVVPPC